MRENEPINLNLQKNIRVKSNKYAVTEKDLFPIDFIMKPDFWIEK